MPSDSHTNIVVYIERYLKLVPRNGLVFQIMITWMLKVIHMHIGLVLSHLLMNTLYLLEVIDYLEEQEAEDNGNIKCGN